MSTSSSSHHSSPSASPKSTVEPTTPSSTSSATAIDTPSSSSSPTTAIVTAATTATATSPTKAQAAIESLSSILPSPLSLSSSPSAAFLLTSSDVSSQISTLLRHPSSGSGDNHLCRWLYDTFQSSDPSLQLVVLRFIPLISGLYLTRVVHHHRRLRSPLAGFEAVLLAVYSHETTSRVGNATTVTVPDLSNPSVYHETAQRANAASSTDLSIAVISPSLDPHGTVRSTRRARIVGVALELFFTKIWVMPLESMLDFCEFLALWAGEGEELEGEERHVNVMEEEKEKENENDGRIPLPWELLQPCMRILGHCMLGENNKGELYHKACKACKCVYNRAMHDVNPKAILAAGSLLRLVKMNNEVDEVDHTEIRDTRVISI